MAKKKGRSIHLREHASVTTAGKVKIVKAEEKDFRPVGAVANAVRLLRTLSGSDRSLSLTEAARMSNVNTPTALNILRTLAAEALVDHDPRARTYKLGVGLFQLTRGAIPLDEHEILRREMKRIASEHDCLTALWQVTRTRVILRERQLANRPIRLDIEVTQRMPVYLGAVGRAVAASRNLSDAELKVAFAGLRWAKPVRFEDYLKSVRFAREHGYAVDLAELYDGINVAAAVIEKGASQPYMGLSTIMVAGTHSAEQVHRIGRNLAEVCRVAGLRGTSDNRHFGRTELAS